MNWSGLLKRVPAFALMAVAVWLLARIALSAWEWARLEPPAPLPARPGESAGNTAAAAPGSSLFGTPGAGRPAGDAPGVLSSADFRLRGVVASSRRSVAHAIIESGGVSRAYFPGDALSAGLTLHEVRPHEVRLRRGAEILRLPLSGLGPVPVRPAPPGMATRFRNDEPADLSDVPARASLSQILGMEPVMENDGSMRGYRISPRASGQRALFDALGLASGDLVVAVNGIPIDSDNLAQARQQMSTGGDMMLTVDRGGERLEIALSSENFGLLAM